MNNKIKIKLTVLFWNSFISMILFLFVLYGQNYTQWQKTSLPSAEKINTLVISDPYIYAGTNGDGIFISSDNGENWISINNELQSNIVHAILINGRRIFVGTETGASVSMDNGLSWSTINSGLSGKGVWSLAVKRNIPGDSTIFAGTSSGVYSSTDNGKNWNVTGLSNTMMPVHSMLLHRDTVYNQKKETYEYKDYVIAATFSAGLFESQDDGLNWRDIGIKYIDPDYKIETTKSVCSLASKSDTMIVSEYTGNIYFKTFDQDDIKDFKTTYDSYYPIFSLAVRNGKIFAGNIGGDILVSDQHLCYFQYGIRSYDWNVNSPSLKDQSIYSMVLNNSYIFAGTENGVWRLWYPETFTSVDNINEVSNGFSLEQNYPNPFNPITNIQYTIDRDRFVLLSVYDVLGREVALLVNKEQSAGKYSVKFNAERLPSGIYFSKLQVKDHIEIKKMTLIK